MAVTVTTKEGWGSRLGGSIKGVLVGLGLLVAGFPVLFWNEGNSVKVAKALDEGEGACIAVESNATVDPEMEGKLVHMSGKADTKDVLADDVFGISATAIRLERKVEMYQWCENEETHEKKNMGGSVTRTTTYTYEKKWCDDLIDSGKFKESGHENPSAFEFPSAEQIASNVKFGAFRLNERQVNRIGCAREYAFPPGFTSKVDRVRLSGTTMYVPNADTRNNVLNNRDVVGQPRIGDMRIVFKVTYPHEISIVAKQHGDTFVGYTAKTGKKVDLLADGVEDAAEMFASARANNSFITWLLRLGGFLLMFIGISCILKPLSVLADVLPILGDIVELGMGLVAFVLALILSLVTIAVAWLFYRPVLAILLLVAAGGLVFWIVRSRRAKAAAAAPLTPPVS